MRVYLHTSVSKGVCVFNNICKAYVHDWINFASEFTQEELKEIKNV